MLVFGRLRGALSLAGLAFSLALVLLFVVPAILHGEPPLAVAVVGGLAIALVTIPLAHGIGPKSLAAVLGHGGEPAAHGGAGAASSRRRRTSPGCRARRRAFLQLAGADLSLEGLLLAGMVIGALGVLDDVTVSQASTVLALRSANAELRFRASCSARRCGLGATTSARP